MLSEYDALRLNVIESNCRGTGPWTEIYLPGRYRGDERTVSHGGHLASSPPCSPPASHLPSAPSFRLLPRPTLSQSTACLDAPNGATHMKICKVGTQISCPFRSTQLRPLLPRPALLDLRTPPSSCLPRSTDNGSVSPSWLSTSHDEGSNHSWQASGDNNKRPSACMAHGV